MKVLGVRVREFRVRVGVWVRERLSDRILMSGMLMAA